MENANRRLLTNILVEAFGLEEAVARRAAALLVKALDAAGLVVMPIEPTLELVQASMMAMRQTRTLRGGSADEVQALKHTIRYRAMVERQRGSLGLSKNTRPAAAKRARKRVLEGRRALPQ